jgi:hypothetical protein
MIDAGATFFDSNGIPTRPDGTPALEENRPGVLTQMATMVGGQPENLKLDQSLLGQLGQGASEQAGNFLLNSLSSQDFPAAPEVPNFHPGMTEAASEFMDRQNLPIDPNRIVYDGEGHFRLDNQFTGQDIFGGRLPKDMPLSGIPRSLQPLLGPSIAAWFGAPQDLVARGGAPGWSRFFAPPAGQGPITPEHGWPGIQHYDAWHRSLGDWANLYS